MKIKNHMLYILSMLMISLWAVSCAALSDDEILGQDDDFIVLDFNMSGVAAKGPIEDNACESLMKHIDVVIYERAGAEDYTPFYHQRINVTGTPDGKTAIGRTKKDFAENVEYRFFVIANSTHPETIYYKNGSMLGYKDFLNLDQTDRLIHLSGVDFDILNPHYPQQFLMDGVAYMGDSEPASPGNIVINDPAADDDVTVKVTLRRAAAKMIITITPGDKVTFTQELMAKSSGYMLRNMPHRTTLVAEGGVGGYPLTSGGQNPYWASTTISQSPYFKMIPFTDSKGNPNYKIELTAYCYSHCWESARVFEEGTAVVMMLPLIYQENDESAQVEYVNNYYQLSVSKKETSGEADHLIRRNTLYDLRIRLNAPGAEDFSEPEDIKDIRYFTAPWEMVDMPVSGENTMKYLKVNKEKMYMYNVSDDSSSLYFSSSSPVAVEYVSGSAYYYNKYNNKVSLSDSNVNISASVQENAATGNISVHSDIPTNNTILYFRLKVTNQEGQTEYVDVEQYPLIYITNNLPWYSYRDDYYYRTGEGHTFRDNTDKLQTAGDAPATYRNPGDHIVSVYQINDVNTQTKKVTYTYSSSTPSNNHGFTASKYRGDKVSNSENYSIRYYYFSYGRSGGSWWGGGGSYSWTMNNSECEKHNVRNYHVRMMASSGNYILGRPRLDEYGYTSSDEENSKLVSPSFVIASRLGAVLSTYSGLDNMSNDKKLVAFADHCKNYVEVDDVNDDKNDPVEVHDNWRLPTEAELKIIIDIQGASGVNADAIDYLLNGAYYMSASGPVYNPKNADGENELADPMKATDVAIRCVRDAF